MLDGLLPDPDDEPILAAALAAHAGYVISHNVRDFPAGGLVAGVRFMTPSQFLTVLEGSHPAAGAAQQTTNPSERLP